MRVTGPLSKDFDESLVIAPEHRGGVAWAQFNRSYERLQVESWTKINAGAARPWWRKLQRLSVAWFLQRREALLDLRGKAAMLSTFDLKKDPDIVFFGAEVGWEAAIVQALFGDQGRVVLVDCDPVAYERYKHAPQERRIKAPRGWPQSELLLRRDPARIEYVRQDFFEWQEPGAFDVGIDWGLIEHFPGDSKTAVVQRMRRMLRADGRQVSAVPRDTLSIRLFYSAFCDELNFGYRELMSMNEFVTELEKGGLAVQQKIATATTCLACCTLTP